MRATITDRKQLFRAVGFVNGMSILMMAYWPRFLGRMALVTTVDYSPEGVVEHTTTVTWLGLPMMKSAETVTLAANGTDFTVSGESKVTMLPWRKQTVRGQGTIDPTGHHATYRVTWFGTELTQTTDRLENGCTLHQEAPGFSASQALVPFPRT